MLLRKKDSDWKPSENKGLEIGETIEIGDYRALVELGMADLVDEAGNILPLPGTVFVCAICFEKMDSHSGYAEHVITAHATVAKQPVDIEEEEEPVIQDKLAKARAAAAANRAKRKAQENA